MVRVTSDVATGLFFLGIFSIFGCGYNLGYRTPPSVGTIAVPIFDNVTFRLRREIEYEVTQALRREIQARTHLHLVDQSVADMVLYGRITEVEEQVIAEGPRDEKLESNIRITIELRVEDYVNQTTYRKTVRDTEPFSVARGESVSVARDRAIGNIVELILIAIEAW